MASPIKKYAETTYRKVRLYYAANHLFSLGRSHPQIVEILSDFENDPELLIPVVDAAMKDKWRDIFNETQRMTAEGRNFQEITASVSHLESDPEIVDFICNMWYRVQAVHAEHTIESGTNIFEGTKGMLMTALGLVFVFGFNLGVVAKIIWALSFLGALVVWLIGFQQRRISRETKFILEEDYMKYKNLI